MPISGRVLGTEDLLRKFKALDNALRGDMLERAVQAGGRVMLKAAKANIKDQQLIRTRNLSRSLTMETEEKNPERASIAVGTNLEYAAIHEYGGTIRAKGKYLAIPVTKTARAATGPREFPLALHLVKGKSGNLVLVSDEGEVHYVLKPSIQIQARPYMRPAWDDNQDEIQKTIAAVAKQQIMKAVE